MVNRLDDFTVLRRFCHRNSSCCFAHSPNIDKCIQLFKSLTVPEQVAPTAMTPIIVIVEGIVDGSGVAAVVPKRFGANITVVKSGIVVENGACEGARS